VLSPLRVSSNLNSFALLWESKLYVLVVKSTCEPVALGTPAERRGAESRTLGSKWVARIVMICYGMEKIV
jgi:hypothetical protein